MKDTAGEMASMQTLLHIFLQSAKECINQQTSKASPDQSVFHIQHRKNTANLLLDKSWQTRQIISILLAYFLGLDFELVELSTSTETALQFFFETFA